MAKIDGIHSIIVPAASADLTAHTYTEVYGGSAGCTLMLNDVSGISIGPSSSVSVWVRTFSGGTGCFFMGEKQNVVLGSTSIG